MDKSQKIKLLEARNELLKKSLFEIVEIITENKAEIKRLENRNN